MTTIAQRNGSPFTALRRQQPGELARQAPALIAFVSGLSDPADLDEAKAQAKAVAEYLGSRREQAVEDYNAAQKVLLRIEHRLGEVLAETVNRGGDRKSNPQAGGLIPEALGGSVKARQHVSGRAQKLARIPWSDVEAKIDEETANGKRVTKSEVLNLAEPLARVRTTGCVEWYTPAKYIEAARWVLGAIDLDPASSAAAQETVKAKTFYSVVDDGLAQPWEGRVFLNPPYAAGVIAAFTDKLLQSLDDGDVTAAILLVNNATDTQWWHRCAAKATAVCFTLGRVAYIHSEDGTAKQPVQGQTFLYFGKRKAAFLKAFRNYGTAMEVCHA